MRVAGGNLADGHGDGTGEGTGAPAASSSSLPPHVKQV